MIAGLYLAGRDAHEISRILSEERPYSLGRRQVMRDLSKAIKRWQDQAKERIALVVGEELAKIDNLERKYWAIFEERNRVDVRFEAMKGIQWCIDRRIKLLGADQIAPRDPDDDRVRITDVNALLGSLAEVMRSRIALPESTEKQNSEVIDAEFDESTEDDG